MSSPDILKMSEDELEKHLLSSNAILDMATPWLVDSGALILDQTLANEDGRPKLRVVVKNLLDEYLTSKQSFMAVMICERFGYCEKKRKFNKRIELVKSVADALCMFLTGIPVPMVLIAAYVVEEGYCERLCGCDEAV